MSEDGRRVLREIEGNPFWVIYEGGSWVETQVIRRDRIVGFSERCGDEGLGEVEISVEGRDPVSVDQTLSEVVGILAGPIGGLAERTMEWLRGGGR